ncbi:MAG TPA: VOC family protein [Thermoanaerobaculia bacterium]|nr:VOC family protein [Thermoanaerobaculia bacterium]
MKDGKRFFPALTMGILLLFVSASSPQTGSGEPQRVSLLGDGRGIDHLVVLVRDLDAAENTFRTLLGFKVKRQGKFPEGVESSSISFMDRGYLEFVGIYDHEKAAQAEVAEFLRGHEGADGMGLHVSSARQTASFLQPRGFQVEGPASMDYLPEGAKEPQQFWLTVSFKEPVVPGGTFFFIEYNEKAIQERRKKNPKVADNTEHANTAQRIKSVWVAVKDLQAAVKAYEALGFTAGRQVDLPRLGATGREIAAGGGGILLLQAHGSDSKVASFLTSRGEGIMGVSIQVAKLKAARGVLETGVKQRFIPYSGAYGKSLLVPLELTRGLWVELFQ